jgi:hypothetical protein
MATCFTSGHFELLAKRGHEFPVTNPVGNVRMRNAILLIEF